MTVLAINSAQQRELGYAVEGLEWFIREPMSLAIARRRAFYEQLARGLGQYVAPALGPELIARHARAAAAEVELARVALGLQRGQLQIVPWWPGQPTSIEDAHLGVARAGGQLGLWPIAAVAVAGVVVAAGVGVWILADLYLSTEKVKVEAEAVRAATAAKITTAVTQLAQTDPQAAAALAAALTAANTAANQAQPAGVLERLAAGVASAASGGVGVAVVLAALWYWGRREKRGTA